VDPGKAHLTGRHRARLVEHDRVDATCRFEHFGAFDDDAEMGGAARADHHRCWRGQAEGARAGHDDHGDGRSSPTPWSRCRRFSMPVAHDAQVIPLITTAR